MVTGGLIAYPLARGKDVLELFREVTASPAEDLMVVAGLLTAADGATKIAGLVAAHIGSPEAGAAAMQSLRKLGTPIADLLGPLPYTTLNSLLDDAFPRGARSYWKSHFLDGLSDGAIDALLETASRLPSPHSSIVIEHFHGAATRVSPTRPPTRCGPRATTSSSAGNGSTPGSTPPVSAGAATATRRSSRMSASSAI